jgi:hypothetical protein
MKRFLLPCLAVLLLCGVVFAQQFSRDKNIYGTLHGPRGSDTINRLITAIGDAPATIVLDSGQWDITNNVTFPTNIGVRIPSESTIWIYTNFTMTVNGEFEAQHRPVFFGPGLAAGTGRFIYRVGDWGDTNQYDIGLGDLVNIQIHAWDYVAGDTNRIQGIMTNAYPLLDIDYTDDGDITNTAPTYSYIRDAYLHYQADTIVSVTNGEGWCSDTYFSITNSLEHTLTSLADSNDIHYVYIDYDASTFPSDDIQVYDSTNEPIAVIGWGHGMYNTAETNDRLIGSVYSPTGTVTMERFHRQADALIFRNQIEIASSNSPTANWIAPTDQRGDVNESSSRLPVTATEALFFMEGTDSGALVHAWIGAKEFVNDPAENNRDAGHIGWTEGYSGVRYHVWVPLGISRDVRIGGANDDENQLYCWLVGWREKR